MIFIMDQVARMAPCSSDCDTLNQIPLLLHVNSSHLTHIMTTFMFTEPRPPTNLQASNVLPTAATVAWQTPPPNRMTPWAIVISYQCILAEYAFGLANVIANTTTQSYTFTSLEEFNNYTVIVAAENTVGRGGFSLQFNFSTPQAGTCSYELLYYHVKYKIVTISVIGDCLLGRRSISHWWINLAFLAKT